MPWFRVLVKLKDPVYPALERLGIFLLSPFFSSRLTGDMNTSNNLMGEKKSSQGVTLTPVVRDSYANLSNCRNYLAYPYVVDSALNLSTQPIKLSDSLVKVFTGGGKGDGAD